MMTLTISMTEELVCRLLARKAALNPDLSFDDFVEDQLRSDLAMDLRFPDEPDEDDLGEDEQQLDETGT